MREITYEGVKHRLSERNWKQLLRRFDAKKAKRNSLGYYYIKVGSICLDRDYKCIRCPLRDPHKETNSCTYLLKGIIGDELFPHLLLFDTVVMWDPKHDKEVHQALLRVEDVLSAAKKL